MERLRERRFAPGSLEAKASELLRAREPYVVPEGLKRRVRERLLRARPKRWRTALFRPALAVTGSLLAVGALAAVGGAALAPRERAAPQVSARASAALSVIIAPAQARASAPVLPRSPTPNASQQEQAPLLASAVLAAATPVETRRNAPERSAHAEAVSEAALVYGAAKALRNHGEAALAAKLLDDYARRYSHGALAEEALALSIDVSIARGDGQAKELATRYLSRYPSGHFRAKAERELAR